jgi:exodeoxyribonuclease VII large subunit
MYENERLTLYEICQRIQETIYEGFPESIWIIAEIGEMKEHRTGHCYMELVEKNDNSEQPKARARATIWGGKYRVLKPFFEMATGRKLMAGLKVLVLCEVNYHPVYGFSLNIQDIDPNFTIGEIEKRKQETIQKIIDEGIFDMNKQIDFPILPKRIAVISSPTAAGYEDFTNQLDSNAYGYRIQYTLFEAIMQGDKAESSIVNALDRIHQQLDQWDVVAIIRGGGSQTDLSSFDGYIIASNIAQFPLPIITGIGHEKDITVADLVAHTRLKTPTAAAQYILGAFSNAENLLIDVKDDFIESVNKLLSESSHLTTKLQGKIAPLIIRRTNSKSLELHHVTHSFNEAIDRFLLISNNNLYQKAIAIKPKFQLVLNSLNQKLETYDKRVKHSNRRFINFKSERITSYEKMLNYLDPENVMKRGFSITRINGKIVKQIENVKKEEIIETILINGKIVSRIQSINKTGTALDRN